MVTKFKVGDKIVGKKKYKEKYVYTSYKNGGYGVVTAIIKNSIYDLRVVWIGGKHKTNSTYPVESKYFEHLYNIKTKGNDYVA